MSPETESLPGPRERELFLAALDKTDPAERRAFLDAACHGDGVLRKRLEDLLREQGELGTFLQQAALAQTPVGGGPSGGTAFLASITERIGDRIGRYRLLQQIGEGGCGVVYMAEQEEPVRRRVALKVIKMGMDTKSVIARFEAERQALAMMEHPNIARVLDAGTTEIGRPFFVMELVRGVRITEYCDQNRLSTAERLALFIQVCQAVQHAHQKGIIHRDLKPSNILVTLHDGVAVPKIIDFGIAKATEQRLTDKTLFTEFQAFIGTPAYMSPEQAEMSGLDIDTRSDVYSLGVLLYELLTGTTPFDAETLVRGGLDECRRTIREQEPARPSTRLATLVEATLTTTAQQRRVEAPRLIHLLRGDLDWVVMKCLEKDRTRRYATANALAADVQCYLDSEPVLARPPSTWYRMQKLLRRHRLVVGASAGVVATLLAGASLSTWQAIRATRAEAQETRLRQQAERERARAEQEKAAARLNEYVADMNLAQQSMAAGNFGRAVQLVEKHHAEPGEPDLRGFEWRYLWQLCRGDEHTQLPGQDGPVLAVAVSPDGRMAAAGLREQLVLIDLGTRREITRIPKGAIGLAFHPDGKTLISASLSVVRVWRTSDWREQRSMPDQSGPIALTRDGRRLATRSRDGVRVWDTTTWGEVCFLAEATGPVAFSPDGETLATDSREGIALWRLDENRKALILQDSTNLFPRAGPWFRMDRVMAFSPDGKSLVATRNPPTARGIFVVSVWDVHSGAETAWLPSDPELTEHTGVIGSLAFSPDGRTLVTASWDHSIRLWDFPTLHRTRILQGHRNEVWSVAFAPDGQTLLSGGKDGGLNVWPVQAGRQDELLPAPWIPLAFSSSGRSVAALNPSGSLGLFNLATREAEQQYTLEEPRRSILPSLAAGPGPGPPNHAPNGPPPHDASPGPQRQGPVFGFMPSVAVSADLRVVAHGRIDGTVHLWDTQAHEETTFRAADGRFECLALSPDGRVLITGGRGHTLSWWDLRDSTNALLTLEGHRAVFSRDGRVLAVLNRGNEVRLYEVASRLLRTNLVLEPPPGFVFTLSPDGRILASTTEMEDIENTIHLWSADSGQFLGSCAGHKQPVAAVAFAPDGRTLASSSDDGTVKLWNVASRQELLSVRRPGMAPRRLLFSPDGRLLVGASDFLPDPRSIRIHRAPTLAEIDAATRASLPSSPATAR